MRSTEPRCRGLFAGVRSGICTHGADPAPAGRDVRQTPSTAQVRQAAGLSPVPSVVSTTPGTATPPSGGAGAIVCSGDGTTGKRVEVLYLRPADKTDRFASIKDALRQYVVRADRQLNASAAETNGSRHWRFVTEADPSGLAPCALKITKVDVGAADDDSFDATVTALRSRSYNRADRKYLIFGESSVYCGIGSIYSDSQPGQANINNGYYAQYARADSGCWNYAEAHELMHNLGGVQTGAPNATPNFHCSDESDEMCYDDDGSGPVVMRNVCSGRDGSLFDCNHDDYSDLAGYRVLRDGVQVASLGKVNSYVDSGLLSSRSYSYVVRAADSSGNLSANSAGVSATPLARTTTTQVSGTFKRGATSVKYTRSVQPGALRGIASGSSKGKAAPVTLILRNAAGTVLGTKTGTSVDVQATATAAGAHSWTISGASGVSYAMTLTYQTP